MEKKFDRTSNGHTYRAVYDDSGALVELYNETTGKQIPLASDTGKKFQKGRGFHELS